MRCVWVAAGSSNGISQPGHESLSPPSQIRVLEYDPDQEVLRSAAAFTHDNEVWDLAPSPSGSHVATVHSKGGLQAAPGARRAPNVDADRPAHHVCCLKTAQRPAGHMHRP